MYRQLPVMVNPDLSKSGGHFLIIIHFFLLFLFHFIFSLFLPCRHQLLLQFLSISPSLTLLTPFSAPTTPLFHGSQCDRTTALPYGLETLLVWNTLMAHLSMLSHHPCMAVFAAFPIL